jgi:hypothetical protein
LNFLNIAPKHTHLVNFHLGWNLDDWDTLYGLRPAVPYVMSSFAAVANLNKPEVFIANDDHTERITPITLTNHGTEISLEALDLHLTHPNRLHTTFLSWLLGTMAPAPLAVVFGHCSGNKAGKPRAAGEKQQKI